MMSVLGRRSPRIAEVRREHGSAPLEACGHSQAREVQHVALRSIELDRLFACPVDFSPVLRPSQPPTVVRGRTRVSPAPASTSRRDYDVNSRADVEPVVAEADITPCERQ